MVDGHVDDIAHALGMKDMIQIKERELQEMNEYRIRSLEKLVIAKVANDNDH